jgi:hypothetical protein
VGGPRDAPHGFSTPGNGAPTPPGVWKRHWDGPDRDIDRAGLDFGPFNSGWGFWFFDIWVPLF